MREGEVGEWKGPFWMRAVRTGFSIDEHTRNFANGAAGEARSYIEGMSLAQKLMGSFCFRLGFPMSSDLEKYCGAKCAVGDWTVDPYRF